MDPLREEGGFQRDEKPAAAQAHHLEDLLGEQNDVPQSWVTGKSLKKRVDIEVPANDPKGTLCGTEFSINCGAEPKVQEINLLGVQKATEEQKTTLKQGEKGPDKEVEREEGPDKDVEETLLISSDDEESDASCSFGSSDEDIEVEEECEDMDDSDEDEDEGEIMYYQNLPMPVPTTADTAAVAPAAELTKTVVPARSLLQMKFPHLRLPSSHPLHLLQPVNTFQPHSQLFEVLTEMGISSRAATKALFWTGNCRLQAAADWCFSNPGREMELLSLEEEVVMWMQDLAIKEEEEASDFQEWIEELQMEARRKAQVERMLEEAEVRRAIQMSKAMQENNAMVHSNAGKEEITLVETSDKEEITLVETSDKEEGEITLVGEVEHVVNTKPRVVCTLQDVMDISDDSDEGEYFVKPPRAVLFLNYKAWHAVDSEVTHNVLLMELYKEAEESCEEMLDHWEEAGLSFEIRLLEDEEALLEKREVVTCCHTEEEMIWVEKWAGGVGSCNVRTFVAFAIMGKAKEVEELVEDTCLIGMSSVDPFF